MIRFAFLLTLLTLVAVSAGEKPEMGEMELSMPIVDIVQENGTLILLSFEATPGNQGNNIAAVEVQLTLGAASLVLTNGQSSGTEYQFVLPVADHRLTMGTWNVRGIAIDALGRTNQTAAVQLEVIGTDAPEFNLIINNQTENFDQIMAGLGTTVEVTINTTDRQDLLGQAQWRTNGTWRAMSRFGANLEAKNFGPETGTLDIQFKDRLNRLYNASIAYNIDSSAPELTFAAPNRLFSIVENTIQITSNENGTLVYNFNGNQSGANIIAGVSTSVPLQVNKAGIYSLSVAAFDARGNTNSQSVQYAFVRPTTEVTLTSAVVDKTSVLLGESITLTALWNQTNAAASASVTGNISEAGEELHVTTFTLGKDDSFEWARAMLLPPGKHELVVDTAISSAFNQSALNITRMVTVEVFLGKVIVKEDVFFVRQGPNGFPSEAVNETTSFALLLREDSLHPIYDFDGYAAFWDSKNRVTTIESEMPEEKRETPFVPILFVVLGLLAIRRR